MLQKHKWKCGYLRGWEGVGLWGAVHRRPQAERKGPEAPYGHLLVGGRAWRPLESTSLFLLQPLGACQHGSFLPHLLISRSCCRRTRQTLCWRSVSGRSEAAVIAGPRQRESSQAKAEPSVPTEPKCSQKFWQGCWIFGTPGRLVHISRVL